MNVKPLDLRVYEDREIALALARLPLTRLEAITRDLLATLDVEARARIAGAYVALPTAAGRAVETVIRDALARGITGRR